MTERPAQSLDVTVVIAAYNRSGLIVRALDSVRKQVRTAAEIIVVDDASTDNTAEVAARWGEQHAFPVRILKLPRNSGPASARNRGIELARTTYVAFLDSDDEQLPTALARLVPPLEAFPDAVVSFADATLVTPDEMQEHAMFAPHLDLNKDAIQLQDAGPVLYRFSDAKSKLLKGSLMPTSATCFSREAALRIGGMPEKLRSSEDWFFWLRLSQEGIFIFQLNDLARTHRHGANLTHSTQSEFIARERIRARCEVLVAENGIVLSHEQRQTIHEVISEYLRSWRYFLSRWGLRNYFSGLQQFAVDYPELRRKFSPFSDVKNLLRAIFFSSIRNSST